MSSYQSELEELEDPDSIGEDAQFSWDEDFQKHIIALLLTDRSFLLQSIELVKPHYFTNKAHQKACKIVYEFYEKYKTLPDKIVLMQELKQIFAEDKSKLYYLGEIESIYEYFETSIESREYLADKITFFAKIQSLRFAFNKSLKLIAKAPESEDTWSKVYNTLRDVMLIDRKFDVGLEYFKTLEERYERMEKNNDSDEEVFITGFEAIDYEIKGGGYKRGEMISIMAGSGIGKSVVLTNIAVANIIRGKKCLYIACGDANTDRVAERFDSVLTGLPVQYLLDVKDNVFEKLTGIMEHKKDKNPLIIKWFPSNNADINMIRSYIHQLCFYGFTPDMIVVDYIGEMKDYPGMPTHESREKLVKEIRGLGGEEGLFVATAMQPNRSSKAAQDTGVIEEDHLGDSYGQVRPLDALFSLNQNKNEEAIHVCRLWIIKQRFGKKRYFVYLRFDPENLKVTQIHHDTYKDLMSRKKDTIVASIEQEQAGSICKSYNPKEAALKVAKLTGSDLSIEGLEADNLDD